jgi:hypothetical protein
VRYFEVAAIQYLQILHAHFRRAVGGVVRAAARPRCDLSEFGSGASAPAPGPRRGLWHFAVEGDRAARAEDLVAPDGPAVTQRSPLVRFVAEPLRAWAHSGGR